jgi:hypothetical protein
MKITLTSGWMFSNTVTPASFAEPRPLAGLTVS